MPKLILVHGRDFYSRLIRWETFSPYSHAAFEFDDGFQIGAESGGVGVYPPSPGTVITRFDVDGLDIEKAVDAACSQVGKPYDWTAIAGLVMRRDWRETDSWFCSELVAWACEQAGTPLLRANRLNRITPGQIALSPLLRESGHARTII